jgi:hypothetical protein
MSTKRFAACGMKSRSVRREVWWSRTSLRTVSRRTRQVVPAFEAASFTDFLKRPCINEVLASIDVIAHGQFGNWCIQHVCEHGAPADRSRAVDHILRFATEYSMDQYASKVIEKCLKIGGNEFLDRYLERVCEGRQDRPRMPLIDSK